MKNSNDNLIIWITGICVTMGPLAGFMYIPSLPVIAQELQVSAGAMQASVAVFVISFGLSGLFYGPLSDYYGRKPIFLVAGSILIISNLWVVFAHDLTQIMLSRFVQGMGAGGLPIFVRTVLRDRFSGQRLNQAMSLSGTFVAIAPIVAPLLGAFFAYYFNWRAGFIFLVFYSALMMLIAGIVLPETNQNRRNSPMSLSGLYADFLEISKHKVFLYYALCGLFSYAASRLYLMITPFIFTQQLGLPVETSGTLMVLPLIAVLLARVLSNRLNRYWPISRIMYLGIGLIIAGALLSIANLFLHLSLLIFILSSITVAVFGAAIILTNSIAGAMKPFPEKAGKAAALLSLIQIGGGGVISMAISYFNITHLSGLGFGLLVCGLALLIIYPALLKSDDTMKKEKNFQNGNA